MTIRVTTAVLVASLWLAGPSLAAFDADVLPDAFMAAAAESPGAAPDRALEGSAAAAMLGTPAERSAAGGTTPAEEVSAIERAALAPELFLDPNEAETFAWIAADLAASGELATGSLDTDPRDESPAYLLQDEDAFSFAEPAVAPAPPSVDIGEAVEAALEP